MHDKELHGFISSQLVFNSLIYFNIILHWVFFVALENLGQLPPISLCTSCGLALKSTINISHATKNASKNDDFCWFKCGFHWWKTEAFLLHLELEEPVLGVPGNCILADVWEWKLKNKHFRETQIQMVDLVHFFWYLLYLWILGLRSDVRDANQFDIRGQLQTWEFHGNSKVLFRHGKKEKGQFSWYILLIFDDCLNCLLYELVQNTLRIPLFFLIMLQ